jgi:dihydrofolate reductase
MSKITLMMSVSIDGFMEGPNRELDWQLVDAELHQHFNDYLRTVDAFLEGRVAHELMAGYWPTADQDPDSSPQEAEFAAIWRDVPKYVYSRTAQDTSWNTTIVRRVDRDEVMALKSQPGGELSIGGAELSASFMRLDLIDEYRLYVHPVVIGRGKPMFPPDVHIDLALVETRAFGNGVVMLRYERR